MATTASDPRKVNVSDLRGIIIDTEELTKGTRIFDEKGLSNLSRHQNKLFCEAKGSGPSPYRVALTFSETSSDIRAKCTCPAAWNRAFCKHAAALLIAWSRAPEAFVVSDAAPAGAPGEAKKKSVKQGSVDRGELMKQGAAQIGTLVRDLGVAGVAAASDEWAPQLDSLGEALRENKLRRLSARVLDLGKMLGGSAARKGALSATAYTDLVADMLLTARKLEKHLGGEAIDDRHVEELIGKTWRETDRKPVAGLDLVEYAYQRWTTSDDYKISESRYFDLGTGAHYSEKQIDPPPPAPRRDPKPSRAGPVLTGARGSVFPTYPPLRLKIADLGDFKRLDDAALARLVDKALPDVGSALAALQEHRRDVFAPDLLPAAIRVDTLFARGKRVQAVDTKGHAIHLPEDPRLDDRLGTTLHEGKLAVLIGDLGIDSALPTLWPAAAVVEGPLGLELRSLLDSAIPAAKQPAAASGWIAAARAASASPAAIALGEVREELADAFVLGLAGLSARVADPLAARLHDLGLAKQAELLQSLLAKAEPADRIDDFVKLYQVLGIALVRLAGATQVDRASLERVPTYESVFVARPAEWVLPEQVEKLRGEGALNRYEAAVHYAHHYEGLPREVLAESIYPIWANGSAAPYVVRAFSGRGPEGVAAAKKALSSKRGRVAKITAIRVLQAVATPESIELLRDLAANEGDVGLRARAADARDAIDLVRGAADVVRTRRTKDARRVDELTAALLTAPQKEVRVAAIHQLTSLGAVSAIPALRQAFFGDAARDTREEAALALGLLGDVELADRFVEMLRRRGSPGGEADAKLAASALGNLGDVRGLYELLAAYAEGYQPKTVAEAIRALGPVAIEPLIALIEERPAIADRKAALSVLEQLPDRDLAATLVARLQARKGDPRFLDHAMLYLKLAGVHLDCRRTVGQAILALLPAEEAGKSLGKAAKKAAL
jgi:HEAT repeat protein